MYQFLRVLPPSLVSSQSIGQAACLSQFQPIGGHGSAGQLVIGQTDWGQTEKDKRSFTASLSSIFPSLKTLYPSIRQMEHHHWSTSMLICTSPYEHAVKVCVCVCVNFQVYIHVFAGVHVYLFPGVSDNTALFACVDICVCVCVRVSVCAWAEDSILDTESYN